MLMIMNCIIVYEFKFEFEMVCLEFGWGFFVELCFRQKGGYIKFCYLIEKVERLDFIVL